MPLVMQQKWNLKVELLIAQLAGEELYGFHELTVNLKRHSFDKSSEASVTFVWMILVVRLFKLSVGFIGMIGKLFLGDEGLVATAAPDHILIADVYDGHLR